MYPDADVDLAVGEFAEHHADLLRAFERHEPRRLVGFTPRYRGTDLVVEIAGWGARAVSGGLHVLGAGREEVAIGVGGERAQRQAVARTGGAFPGGETQLGVQVVEFLGDRPPGLFGEAVERQPDHGLRTARRGVQHLLDGGDGGRPILGLDDRVEQFMAPVERGEQSVGDLAAGRGDVVVGHEEQPSSVEGGACSPIRADTGMKMMSRRERCWKRVSCTLLAAVLTACWRRGRSAPRPRVRPRRRARSSRSSPINNPETRSGTWCGAARRPPPTRTASSCVTSATTTPGARPTWSGRRPLTGLPGSWSAFPIRPPWRPRSGPRWRRVSR